MAQQPLPAWEHNELQAWLRLALTPGIGNGTARRLLARFGSAPAIFEASASELHDCVSAAQASRLQTLPEGFAAALADGAAQPAVKPAISVKFAELEFLLADGHHTKHGHAPFLSPLLCVRFRICFHTRWIIT